MKNDSSLNCEGCRYKSIVKSIVWGHTKRRIGRALHLKRLDSFCSMWLHYIAISLLEWVMYWKEVCFWHISYTQWFNIQARGFIINRENLWGIDCSSPIDNMSVNLARFFFACTKMDRPVVTVSSVWQRLVKIIAVCDGLTEMYKDWLHEPRDHVAMKHLYQSVQRIRCSLELKSVGTIFGFVFVFMEKFFLNKFVVKMILYNVIYTH